MKGFKKDGKFRPTGRSKSEFSKKQMMSHEEHWKDAKEEIGEDAILRILQKQNDKYSEELKNRKKEYIDNKIVVGDYSHRNAVLTKAEFDKYAEMIYPPEKVMHGHLTYESPKDRWFVYQFGKQEGLFKVDDNGDPIRDKETLDDEPTAINIKNYEKKSKLITDAERRTLEQRGSDDWREDHETGNYPDDGMTTRSNQDSNQNFTIQTRAVARKELDERSKKTRRDNPQTPLIDEVPFGKDSRPKNNSIGQSLDETDTQDSHLALDYTDELNPISRAGYRSTGFGSGVTEKPKRQDWTRIIAKKKTIEVNQTEGQKHRADKAKREGTHKHEGFNKLTKDIKKGDSSISDDSANKIAGSIQAKSKKKFGSKTVSKHGKLHVEPAI